MMTFQRKKIMDDSLRAKLEELQALEKEHNVKGVSFTLKKGAELTTEESIDFVMDLIKRSAELLDNKDNLKRIPEVESKD